MPPPDVTTDLEALLHAAVSAVGGSERPGQVTMAHAVAEAIDAGRHLLVQAGTGTGKSLGYLVPAVVHALTSREPVVVSTATLALQAQVVDRDLPRLVDAVAPLLGTRPAFALVKGRRNYLCRHKLDGGFPEEDEPSLFSTGGALERSRLGEEVVRLRDWADRTRSGDRDELVPGVSERAWRQVSVSARECLGSKCPQVGECFVEHAREDARHADVVVTNHALLAIDSFEGRQLLPDHDVVVIDEGHELTDRVTSVITDELTASMVEAASRRAGRLADADEVQALSRAGENLGLSLTEVAPGRVTSLPAGLVLALTVVRDAARSLLTVLKASDGGDSDGARQVARAAVQEVFDVADRLLAESANDVAWLSDEPRRGLVLRVAPLSIATLLREKLFSGRTVVLTSATLALGGTFDPIASSLGLAGAGAPDWSGVDVGSPFAYRQQAILYTAAHLPPPGRDGISTAMLEELEALVRAAGGRTLGLFSSMRAAQAAAEYLREHTDLPILCQGEEQTATLVRDFARDSATCLLGTLSLWQGVDVPGPACQLVVIDRIPFPRPDDPLMSARARAVASAGGNGFMAVSATHAALLLAQGSGRLVRTLTDRGVVAVLDSRLASARYAPFLRASLPPFWPTSDRDAVLAALARIDVEAGEVTAVLDPGLRADSARGRQGRRRSSRAEAPPPAPAPASSRSAVVKGKAWTPEEDTLLVAGLEAGRSLHTLAERHEATPEQLLARLESLGRNISELS